MMLPSIRSSAALPCLLAGAVLFATTRTVPAQDAHFFRILSSAPSVITGCTADGYVSWSNWVPGLVCTVQTATVLAPGNWVDYLQVPVSNYHKTHRLFDNYPPAGMAYIPAGVFTMGNTFEGEGDGIETPAHSVYVSAIYMDRYEVTKALWDQVYRWALNHGYTFDFADSGQGKATNHPAYNMNWYDAVKWCNARSEREGLTPAYYTDSALSVRYRSNDWLPYVDWTMGYRLPTEAEWEKAARGGPSGQRFPWGNTITHSLANYYSSPGNSYDTSPTRGFHPVFYDGVLPGTSPAGSFAPNGYGLYDMSGNVWEWCWDRFSTTYYSSSPWSNPRGPAIGSYRMVRGGSWDETGFACRTTARPDCCAPSVVPGYTGFRTVLPANE